MMNMQSRNQYLVELRTEYLRTKLKKKRSELLDEAEKRTKLNRKYLMDTCYRYLANHCRHRHEC